MKMWKFRIKPEPDGERRSYRFTTLLKPSTAGRLQALSYMDETSSNNEIEKLVDAEYKRRIRNPEKRARLEAIETGLATLEGDK